MLHQNGKMVQESWLVFAIVFKYVDITLAQDEAM